MRLFLVSFGLAAVALHATQTEDRVVTVANELRAEGRFAEAERAYRSILPSLTGMRRAQVLNLLGITSLRQAKHADAVMLHREAAELFASLTPPDVGGRAASLLNLAEAYRAGGAYQAATIASEEAITLRESVLGPNDPALIPGLSQLGCLKLDRGDPAGAEPLFRRAIAIGGVSDRIQATLLHNLGETLRRRGRLNEAEPLRERALDLRKRRPGADHRETAATLSGLATLYREMGRIEDAVSLASRALEIRRKLYGPRHIEVAVSLNNISLLAAATGDVERSRALVTEALAIAEQAPEQEHLVGAFLINLAESYKRSGDLQQADTQFRRAIVTLESTAPYSPWVADAVVGLAGVFIAQGKLQGAERLLTKAIALRKGASDRSPEVLAAQRQLVSLYRAQKRHTEAQRLEKSLRPDLTVAGIP